MGIQFTNNASTTLAAGINNSTTTVTVATGTGALFPTLTTGDFFYATIADSSNLEIVKCTARSGDTLTVVRAQDGTTARSFASSSKVELRPTAQAMRDVRDEAASTALALAIALG